MDLYACLICSRTPSRLAISVRVFVWTIAVAAPLTKRGSEPVDEHLPEGIVQRAKKGHETLQLTDVVFANSASISADSASSL